MDPEGAQLRARGLRSTPQRRAILATFGGGPAEHLSAEEIFARARSALSGLGRGTVYATLAEFCEVGLVAAVGSSEPVRYESNTDAHAHFRCRLCLRIYDVDAPAPSVDAFLEAGHEVEDFDLQGEGACADCREYAAGLQEGVAAITAVGALPPELAPGTGAAEIDTPVGRTLIAASPAGVIRVGWSGQGDEAALQRLVGAGSDTAREHITAAITGLRAYFAAPDGGPAAVIDRPDCAMATGLLGRIPVGTRCPYHQLTTELSAHDLGFALGSNPLAILWPCHRVMLGGTVPEAFVGGPERRRWLIAHEAGS